MNIILTRTKEEHLNVWWEPFATSTPLKAGPNNAKIISVPQKQPLMHSNASDFVDKIRKSCRVSNVFQKESKPLVPRKTRKKKSSIYFDLTSSSDEDSSDGNKKRPIIKLRSGKKSVLVNRNLSNEKININEEINNGKKLENISVKNCETHAVFSVESPKCENDQSQNNKDRTLNGALKLGSNFKNTSLSSDDDSKIFDETRKVKNITEDSTLHLVNKENKISNSKNGGNLKYLKVSDNAGNRALKETFTTNPIFKESVCRNNGQNSESPCIPQNKTSEYNKSSKTQKRKYKEDNENSINSVKRTRSKKISDKLVSQIPLENSRTLLHIWEYKNNLSHQLFSDSREQELINILDLTSEEIDEKVKNMESSLIQKKGKLSCKSSNSSHPSINNDCDPNECGQNQPKKKRQNQKKCFMLENPSYELDYINTKNKIKSKRNSKAKLTDNDQIPEFQMQKKSKKLDVLSDGVNPVNCTKNNRKNLKAQKKPKKRTANAPEKSNTSIAINDLLNNSTNDNELKSSELNNVNLLSSMESNTDNNKTADSNKLLMPEKSKKAVGKKKPVFKLLKKLSYKENGMGCSVGQGWSINNFKCGIFKLKVNSQMSCKTLHCSSNLGGVLIKGNIRMKIGNRELNLTEGDMVFVPPLTEWLATNIGKCESLFYYWCGRFDV